MSKAIDNFLKEEFYSVISQNNIDGGFISEIKFKREHWIFQSHFPGNPVTPGVCLIQIARELVSDYYNLAYSISLIKNIKFLNVINPDKYERVSFVFILMPEADGSLKANVSVENEGICFAKISSVYKKS